MGDLTIQKPYEDITLEILEGKTLMDWFLFCEEDGKDAQSERSELLSSGSNG